METKSYRNDVRDTRSNDARVRAAAYERIAQKSARPGFQAPAAIPTYGQYDQQDRIQADKTTAAGMKVSKMQDALLVEEQANKNAEASGTKATKDVKYVSQGGANAPTTKASTAEASSTDPESKMSFADKEIEARQKAALSGAFGSKAKKDAEQLVGRQALFEKLKNAKPEEVSGPLRDEAKKLGVKDDDYSRVTSYLDVKSDSSPPVGSFSEAPSSSSQASAPTDQASAPVNQAKADIDQFGIEEAISRYKKRSADADKAQAESAGKNASKKNKTVDQEIAEMMETAKSLTFSPKSKYLENPDLVDNSNKNATAESEATTVRKQNEANQVESNAIAPKASVPTAPVPTAAVPTAAPQKDVIGSDLDSWLKPGTYPENARKSLIGLGYDPKNIDTILEGRGITQKAYEEARTNTQSRNERVAAQMLEDQNRAWREDVRNNPPNLAPEAFTNSWLGMAWNSIADPGGLKRAEMQRQKKEDYESSKKAEEAAKEAARSEQAYNNIFNEMDERTRFLSKFT
jgi:hypothetical protein